MEIELGGVYALRNGAQVFIDAPLVIPYRINSTPMEWIGWQGVQLSTGVRCSWDLAGCYSPVKDVTNPLDIVLTEPSM